MSAKKAILFLAFGAIVNVQAAGKYWWQNEKNVFGVPSQGSSGHSGNWGGNGGHQAAPAQQQGCSGYNCNNGQSNSNPTPPYPANNPVPPRRPQPARPVNNQPQIQSQQQQQAAQTVVVTGSCPSINTLPPVEVCSGRKSNCWSVGQSDVDCVNNALCCFDGCANTCYYNGNAQPVAPGRPQNGGFTSVPAAPQNLVQGSASQPQQVQQQQPRPQPSQQPTSYPSSQSPPRRQSRPPKKQPKPRPQQSYPQQPARPQHQQQQSHSQSQRPAARPQQQQSYPQQQQQQSYPQQQQQQQSFPQRQQAQRPQQQQQSVPQRQQRPQPQRQQNNFGNAEQKPYVKCPSAMLCIKRENCDFNGVITEQTLNLTPELEMLRVPLIPCVNPQTTAIDVCCRDPNYVDPWPNMKQMNNLGRSSD